MQVNDKLFTIEKDNKITQIERVSSNDRSLVKYSFVESIRLEKQT